MTPWYRSKQFWFNILTVVITLATAFGFESFTPDPRTLVIAQLLIAVINVVLRFAFPSQPPPAHLERTKSGASDFRPPATPHAGPRAGAYRRTNLTAALTFAVATISLVAAIAFAR